MKRAEHAGLQGLYRVSLVMQRRSRTGQIVDFVASERHRVANSRISHITIGNPETFPAERKIITASRRKIIDDENFSTIIEKPLDQMRAHKSGTSCYKDALFQ